MERFEVLFILKEMSNIFFNKSAICLDRVIAIGWRYKITLASKRSRSTYRSQQIPGGTTGAANDEHIPKNSDGGPEEELQGGLGKDQKYWDNIMHSLPGGVPNPHYLSVRACGRVQ
eukprot:XP_014038826.1 PREDICTED: uncharacterized protein LOC106592050 isoform X1 [Salmo salar]